MFKGITKEKFEKYYNERYGVGVLCCLEYKYFITRPIEMQIGVIEDFGETEGYEIEVKRVGDGYRTGVCRKKEEFRSTNYKMSNSKPQARREAIVMLQERLNKTQSSDK